MSDEVNIRLLIDPITKTIAPKYRGQKAVYIAKGDRNSVYIRFEIPRYVDGFDMSAEGNEIHIHYANTDGENVSRDFSDAVNIEDEGDNIIFRWLVPNTATRYAGTVSIGVTFERYDTVDGKAQEVYSWSTAPYGKIIVWDSLDNTAEVVEREYDYLVETCNAIVSATIGGIVDDVKEYYDFVKEKADSVAEIKADIDRKHEEVKESASLVSQQYQSVQTYTEEAKTARDEAKRYASALAVKGETAGTNVVRIDDVSEALPEMDITLTPGNLIDQDGFFASGSYTIHGDVGKTYTLTFQLKAGTDISDVTSGIFDTFDGGMVNHNFIVNGTIERTAVTITIEEGHTYTWITENANASDIFESVSMVCEDVSDTEIKQYGKNLTKVEWNHTVSSRKATAINVPCDVTLSIQKTAGTVLVYKSNDGFATPINIKTFAASITFCELEIEREEGYEYRVATTGTQYIESIQTEVGNVATEYEEYKEPITVSGTSVLSAYPTTTLVSDTKGVDITAKYYRDINKVIAKIEEAIANS